MSAAVSKDHSNLSIKTDIDTAGSMGITATPTLVNQNNQTGRRVKLEGMVDETKLLSAIG